MSNVSPLLQKGAILSLDPTTGIPLGKIMLQYNPDTLTRSLQRSRITPQFRTQRLPRTHRRFCAGSYTMWRCRLNTWRRNTACA